jgi:hypothetical protein
VRSAMSGSFLGFAFVAIANDYDEVHFEKSGAATGRSPDAAQRHRHSREIS